MVYLAHHGIKNQRWGVRRFQNEDGTLTEAGKDRYSDKQRKRDERIYGKKAAEQIGKRISNGEGVQSARHVEVVKKHRKEKVKETAGQILAPLKATAIAAAGAAVLALATNPQFRQQAIRKGKDAVSAVKRKFAQIKIADLQKKSDKDPNNIVIIKELNKLRRDENLDKLRKIQRDRYDAAREKIRKRIYAK